MSSLAETALSASTPSADRPLLWTSGVTLAKPKRFFGSFRTTKPSLVMVGSVVKMSAACTVFFVRAAWVSGPPASSALKDLNFRPYSDSRPFRPWWRVWNSGEPPISRSGAASLRSASVESAVRSYFFAVSALTLTESLSSAGEDSSRVSLGSSFFFTAALTASADSCGAFASR